MEKGKVFAGNVKVAAYASMISSVNGVFSASLSEQVLGAFMASRRVDVWIAEAVEFALTAN